MASKPTLCYLFWGLYEEGWSCDGLLLWRVAARFQAF